MDKGVYQGFVPIEPVPKGRPRFSQVFYKGKEITKTHPHPKSFRFEKMVEKELLYNHPRPQPLDGTLAATVDFYIQRPATTPKKRKYPNVKPDLDNLAKSFFDAAEGILYKNDSRIVVKNLRKLYSDGREPGIEYHISVLDC